MNLKAIGLILPTCMVVWVPAALALSSNDNLGTWAKSTYSEKSSLCDAMAVKIKGSKINASELCSCISEANLDRKSDFLQIAEVAAACSIMLKTGK